MTLALRFWVMIVIGVWVVSGWPSMSKDQPEDPQDRSGDVSMVVITRVGKPNPPQTLSFDSRILGERRHVYVQFPENYERSNARYPVLIVLDGEWLFDLVVAHVRYYSENESTDENMPRMIVVGLENTDRDRNFTPTPNSGNEMAFPTAGEADRFLSFLQLELIPVLEHRLLTYPSYGLVGWSFGGLFSMYAAAKAPETFDAYLCISPAIWWDNDLVPRLFMVAEFESPKRLVMTLGQNEKGGWVHKSTTELIRLLESTPKPNLVFNHFEFENVGHTWGVSAAIDKGLQSLFAGYVAGGGITPSDLSSVRRYYRDLSNLWGYDVLPPSKVFHALALNQWEMGEKNKAIETLQRALNADPLCAKTYYHLGVFHTLIGQDQLASVYLRKAIDTEMMASVPNEVSLRMYRETASGIGQSR